jgi:hypothetical protein
MIEVCTSYIGSAILIAFVFALSLLVGLALKGKSKRTGLLFSLAGALLMAIAALEKIGWTLRPWSRGSPAEALNDLSFRVLFLFGLGLLLVSWTIAFLRNGPRKSFSPSRPVSMESQFSELELGLPPVTHERSSR